MKSITKFFHHSPRINRAKINQSYEFPVAHEKKEDKIIYKSKKKCHDSFGGYWEILTYKKPNGKTYTKHIVKCIKCDRIGSNLYSSQEIFPEFKKSSIENSSSLRKKQLYDDSSRKSLINSKKQNSCHKKNSSRSQHTKKLSNRAHIINFSERGSYSYNYGVHDNIKVSSVKVPSTNVMKLTRHGYNIYPMEISSSPNVSPPKNAEA